MIILAWLATLIGFGTIIGPFNVHGFMDVITLVLGVFWGALAWSLFFTESSLLFRNKVNQHSSLWVNRITGASIFGFAIVALLNLIINKP